MEKTCKYNHICTSSCGKDYDCPCEYDHCCDLSYEKCGECDDCIETLNKRREEADNRDKIYE